MHAAVARVFRLSERQSSAPPVADDSHLGRNGRIDPEDLIAKSKFRVFKRAGYFLAVIWLAIGAAVLFLALVDAILLITLKPARSLRVDPKVINVARENMAANAGEGGYWQEHEAAREVQWRPYVYFRRRPYAGKLIHVDANGFRVTVNPVDRENQRSVWLFGGSTVWGTGVSDAHTLASELAQVAPVQVLNFGETGYVSAQSQLAFMASLRCADAARPDVVVFVDGVNDVFAALQSGVAGAPQNESNRQAEFNMTRTAGTFAKAVLQHLDGIHLLTQRLQGIKPEPGIENLAGQIARNYLAVIAQTRAVAQAQGVRVLFVWQPSVFDKAQPSKDELSVIGSSLLRHRDLQLATTRALKRLLVNTPAADVLLLDQLFDANSAPIFIDFAHTGSVGNALMAQRIKQEIQTWPITTARAVDLEQSCLDRPVLP